MSDALTSERDSLIKAIELAQKEMAEAQDAQKEAEGKIPALQTQMDKQYTTFVFLHSRLEKMGIESPWEEDQEGRIQVLETEYAQAAAENRRLVELLLESAREDDGKAATGNRSLPTGQKEAAPLDPNAAVEIEASPRHEKRPRG
jgi:hypothetical protein